jgi:hypothetical protein
VALITRHEIDTAIPKIKVGLAKYQHLRHLIRTRPRFAHERAFQKAFNGFYRVRRNADWQRVFYATLARCHRHPLAFAQVLQRIRRKTLRTEASFASKLVATLDPSQPVIDSVVLAKLGLSLPATHDVGRHERIVQIHALLRRRYVKFLKTADGRYLVSRFRRHHGSQRLTQIKMLDLVLWQTR